MESKGLPKLLKRVNERICELRADSFDADAEFLLRVRPAGLQRADSAQPAGISAQDGALPSRARARKPTRRTASAAGNVTISRSSIRGVRK